MTMNLIGKCPAQYMPRQLQPGDRIVQCSFDAGHGGDCAEVIDGTVAYVFPRIVLATQPRVWSLPPEPGPEVTAVRNSVGEIWRRDREVWALAQSNGLPPLTHHRHWRALLVGYGPLSDATPVTTEGEA